MAIHFFQENISFPFRDRNKTKAWIRDCVQEENRDLQELSIVFCSDDFLHSLNVTYLQHDTLTDIITFPYSENPIHGELFISIDRIKENAATLKIPFLQELRRVMIHGVLHLCGYGDKSESAKMEMRTKENHYLDRFPI